MEKALKVAYCAGHYLYTPGKRVPAKLDPSQTREWVLNDRVARYFNERMLQYKGVQTMRMDDPTGKKEISIKDRTKAANEWGADVYADLHHNAGADITNAGGVVAYSYPGSVKGKEYRDAVYDAVIEAGGLRGDRSNPKKEKAYKSLKQAKCPAVLIEYGFMDSRVDYHVISTEEYAKAVGYATADAIAMVNDLSLLPQFTEQEGNAVRVKSLIKGDKGDHVEAMQILLIGYGFSCGSYGTDGSFGSATDKAVRAYQKANGLSVDGVCGPKAWAKLLGVE